jgi:hypothetical protein
VYLARASYAYPVLTDGTTPIVIAIKHRMMRAVTVSGQTANAYDAGPVAGRDIPTSLE